MRTQLRLRALLVALLGLLLGALTGALLALSVLSLVAVTASAAAPEPPLRLIASPRLLGGFVALYAAAAVSLILLSTRLGGRAPRRAEEAAA